MGIGVNGEGRKYEYRIRYRILGSFVVVVSCDFR